jgi:diguanylate cyclase (GGDEF)-like protein
MVVEELLLVDGTRVVLNLFDLLSRHGIFLGVVIPVGSRAAPATAPERGVVPVRVTHLTMDGTGRLLGADDGLTGLLGWTLEARQEHHSLHYVHPDDRDGALAVWAAVLVTPGVAQRNRYRQLKVDGTWLWCEVTFVNHLDDPERRRVDAELLDISAEMAAHEEVRARGILLQRLAEGLPLGVLQIDGEREVVYANRRAQLLLHSPAPTLGDLLALARADDRHRLHEAIDGALGTGEDREVEVHVELEPGAPELVYEVTLRAVLDEQADRISGALCCLSDATDRARRRRDLEARATFDALTGAYNREATVEALQAAIEEAADLGGVAALFIDLDKFKQVNDRHGHQAGDRLLVLVADRLRTAVRAQDVVGRIGGDEFLAVCSGIGDEASAVELVARIERILFAPVDAEALTVQPSASIGVAWTRDGDTTAESLIARADAGMYHRKGIRRLSRPVRTT